MNLPQKYNQQDLFQAREARDDAMRRVEDNSMGYSDMAVGRLRSIFEPGAYVTGEDIRVQLEAVLGRPHHHNVWGATINKMIKKGMLVSTGRFRHMRTKASHARKTPEYIIK